MTVWAIALVLAAAPADDAVTRSKAAEARGFELVEKEQWCDAMHAFLEANDAAPSLDLISNAALAADYAGDRQKALKLYADLIGAYPGSERNAEVTARIGELSQKMSAEGAGTACPERAPDESTGTKDTSTAVESSKTPENAGAEQSDEGGLDVMAFVPWTMLASGVAVFVVGGALAVVGVVPYMGHAQARSAILEAEAAGADATDAQEAQTMWRGAWETWGLASVVVGATAGVLGTLVGASGGALGVAGLTLDEDAPAPAATEPPKTAHAAIDEVGR
mgnify:CR=1 FL=1